MFIGHLTGDSQPSSTDNNEWETINSLIKMWIYGTLTQSLLNMTKPGSTPNSLSLVIEVFLRDNNDACIMELEKKNSSHEHGEPYINKFVIQ